MACSLLMLSACRPKTEELAPEKQTAKNKNAGENYVPSPKLGGKINPYSMKNIREVKELFGYLSIAPDYETGGITEDEKIMLTNLATMPIDNEQVKLYVSWKPDSKGKNENFAQTLKNSPDIQIFPYPLDTTTYKIQAEDDEQKGSDYIEKGRENGKLYAVLTPEEFTNFNVQTPAQILDTLYFPKQEEALLEFFAHLLTDNIDEQTLMTLSLQYPLLYQEINTALKEGGFQRGKEKFIRRFIVRIVRFSVNIIRHAVGAFSVGLSGLAGALGWGTVPTGMVRVQDDIRNQTVPVVGVSVNVIHWGRIATGRTDASGNYTIPNTRMLFGSIVFLTFENQNARITPVDIRAEFIVPAAAAAFIMAPATHVVGFRAARDMANMQHTFIEHSQVKYWSTILNALHEYRTAANQRQILNPQKLVIWAVWGNQRLAASAPMFGYLAGGFIDSNAAIVGSLLNVKGPVLAMVGTYLEAFLPDVLLTEQATAPLPEPNTEPYNSSLTARIKFFGYHEFAHTSHFFKVTNGYWSSFISHTLTPPTYGTNINTQPGRFCALPEAWAQYMAYQLGAQYYPNLQFSLPDPLLPRVLNSQGVLVTRSINRTLIEHAEINEMFYNDFIPCGLFYDLMDVDPNTFANTDERGYDRISGYTTKQIFDLMEEDVRSMQEYKVRFERTYGANANTQDLFRYYGL